MYNVIWLDDQHETLESIIDSANQAGIKLIGFSNAEEGILELQNNIELYDAAVLDGLFNLSASQVGDIQDQIPLMRVSVCLQNLANRKYLPKFVLSGQDIFTEGSNQVVEGHELGRVYNKLTDKEALWASLKSAAYQQPETQIRHKYKHIFQACSAKFYGIDFERKVLELLKPIEIENRPPLFIEIRKLIERLFRVLVANQLLPEAFITNNQVALNESSKFLAGKPAKNYQLNQESHLPKPIASSLQFLLAIVQDAAHDGPVNFHVQTVNTNYLYQSCVLVLCDILIWFKNYLESNPKRQTWVNEELNTNQTLKGTVHSIHQNGYGFFTPSSEVENIFIPKHLVDKFNLKQTMEISVSIEVVTHNNQEKPQVTQIHI